MRPIKVTPHLKIENLIQPTVRNSADFHGDTTFKPETSLISSRDSIEEIKAARQFFNIKAMKDTDRSFNCSDLNTLRSSREKEQ